MTENEIDKIFCCWGCATRWSYNRGANCPLAAGIRRLRLVKNQQPLRGTHILWKLICSFWSPFLIALSKSSRLTWWTMSQKFMI